MKAPVPPDEVREVADAIIATLGDNLSALLWHGSWARGEQTAQSDHDIIVVVRQMDDETLFGLREVFEGRSAWSTYVKTEQELRQYPLTGRLQFHYGSVTLYGGIDAPQVTREGLIEDLRRAAVDIQHESRYRLIHVGGGKMYEGIDPAYPRMRIARWMYYQAKLAVLALKARELLRGRSYPETRRVLRDRLTDEEELALVDVIDLWGELRARFEEDVTPLALQLDAVMRGLVAELDAGLGR
ncbi:MAG TPA: nucleotidyltransferase domain-containing protein [Dehalococcoidia bacterium]|nr:nucleotidyltransferase domain-containing protein [Dehalococcoidia bacterium]